jgi:hypothetical protein
LSDTMLSSAKDIVRGARDLHEDSPILVQLLYQESEIRKLHAMPGRDTSPGHYFQSASKTHIFNGLRPDKGLSPLVLCADGWRTFPRKMSDPGNAQSSASLPACFSLKVHA